MTQGSVTTESLPPSKAMHRLTFRVPWIDTTVKQWWDAQLDPSASLRSLIRAEIERNGITDTLSRPVTQQPRRGRPPAIAVEITPEPEEPTVAPDTPTTVATSISPTTPPTAPSTPQPDEDINSGGQVDMGVIFGPRN